MTVVASELETGRIVLRVDYPEAVAARCWDAGYTVLVEDRAGGSKTAAALAVIDPFGLRIDLDRVQSR